MFLSKPVKAFQLAKTSIPFCHCKGFIRLQRPNISLCLMWVAQADLDKSKDKFPSVNLFAVAALCPGDLCPPRRCRDSPARPSRPNPATPTVTCDENNLRETCDLQHQHSNLQIRTAHLGRSVSTDCLLVFLSCL